MIKETSALQQDNLVTLKVVGKLEKRDYTEIFHPMIDQAARENKKIRALILFGPDFEGFSPGAAWEDFKLGVHHWNSFEKIALVTDRHGLASAARFFGTIMPGEFKAFSNDQQDEAEAWLRQ